MQHPLDETHFDAVRGLLTEKFHPSASTRRGHRSDTGTVDQSKRNFFMLMPRTWFKMKEYRLD